MTIAAAEQARTLDVQRVVDALTNWSTAPRLSNYILPGLYSTKLADTVGGGMARLFEMTRHQETEVVPHNHRYAFQCFVLEGEVEHFVYRVNPRDKGCATHAILTYDVGTHALDLESARFVGAYAESSVHAAGSWYGLSADSFHRVRFSAGAKVLFLEGADERESSDVLLPYSAGRICSTFAWADWMMQPEDGR